MTSDEAFHFLERVERCREQGSAFCFGLFDAANSRIAGMVVLSDFDVQRRRARLGYWVSSDYSGQNLATSASRRMLSFSFGVLSLLRIDLVILEQNAASVRVAHKLGAKLSARAADLPGFDDCPQDSLVYTIFPDDCAFGLPGKETTPSVEWGVDLPLVIVESLPPQSIAAS